MLIETSTPALVLTCAIIDDDEINRLTLEHCISLTPSLDLVASLPGGVEGLNFFSLGRRVDLLFLDVEMPDLNGIDMLRLLPEPPEVIFTTAYESFGAAGTRAVSLRWLRWAWCEHCPCVWYSIIGQAEAVCFLNHCPAQVPNFSDRCLGRAFWCVGLRREPPLLERLH